MPISVGDTVRGFTCTSIDFVEEIDANAIQFTHQKTDAPVLILECEDDNKVFCTYFRTPVKDDTGVPHILEHSVLNGLCPNIFRTGHSVCRSRGREGNAP